MYVLIMSTKLAKQYHVDTQSAVQDVIANVRSNTGKYPGASVATITDDNVKWYRHTGDYDVSENQLANPGSPWNLFVTRKYAGEQVTGWLCVLGAAPFAACGFFRYHGMTAEQFAWAVIKSELLYPKRLVFKSENLYFSCMEESLRLGEKMMGNGAELLEKKRTKQKKPKKRRGRGDAFD